MKMNPQPSIADPDAALAPWALEEDGGGRGAGRRRDVGVAGSPYLTTGDAAAYMRKSTSWLLKQADIPFLRGTPNVYRRDDLDDWFDRHKFRPTVR